ncbi:hypothetical protein BDV32DRAFT_129390 [Aspergillus pseudonomiae]|nr:hypothetical protein BDV32DRAFT_129390 [Aspergillus pseudonomiae]
MFLNFFTNLTGPQPQASMLFFERYGGSSKIRPVELAPSSSVGVQWFRSRPCHGSPLLLFFYPSYFFLLLFSGFRPDKRCGI